MAKRQPKEFHEVFTYSTSAPKEPKIPWRQFYLVEKFGTYGWVIYDAQTRQRVGQAPTRKQAIEGAILFTKMYHPHAI